MVCCKGVKTMYIWIIKTDWAVDGETGGQVTLYANECTAKDAFNVELQELKRNAEEKGYVIEEDDGYFCAYNDGEYLFDHDVITLEKMNVIE